MSPIRTMLVDDERAGRNRLRRLLEKELDLEIVADCADGTAAVRAIRESCPELLFLDIQMPGMDGFTVLEEVGNAQDQMVVVFVTAYDAHALRAFDACALDYLLKPVAPERLSKTLIRARARVQALRQSPASSPLRAVEDPTGSSPGRFLVRNGGRISFILPEQISWVEAAGNYAILHVGSANHMIRETMNALEYQLGNQFFLRASRSAILNLRCVKELRANGEGEYEAVLHDGTSIPITRSWREVAERLGKL